MLSWPTKYPYSKWHSLTVSTSAIFISRILPYRPINKLFISFLIFVIITYFT